MNNFWYVVSTDNKKFEVINIEDNAFFRMGGNIKHNAYAAKEEIEHGLSKSFKFYKAYKTEDEAGIAASKMNKDWLNDVTWEKPKIESTQKLSIRSKVSKFVKLLGLK